MNPRPKFEPVRAVLMNRDPFPTLETCPQDFLCEEIRLISQQTLIANSMTLLTLPSKQHLLPRMALNYRSLSITLFSFALYTSC